MYLFLRIFMVCTAIFGVFIHIYYYFSHIFLLIFSTTFSITIYFGCCYYLFWMQFNILTSQFIHSLSQPLTTCQPLMCRYVYMFTFTSCDCARTQNFQVRLCCIHINARRLYYTSSCQLFSCCSTNFCNSFVCMYFGILANKHILYLAVYGLVHA